MADSAQSRLSGSRRQFLPLVAAIVLIIVAGISFGYIQLTASRDSTWNELAKQFPADAETLVSAGRSAQPDFATLSAISGNFDDNITAMRQGDSAAGIAAAPSSVQPELEALSKSWGTMRQSIRDMLANEKAFTHITDNIDAINGAADAATADYEQVMARLSSRGAPAQIVFAASQMVRLEQIKTNVARLVYAARSAQGSPDSLAKLTSEFIERNKQLEENAGSDATIDAALRKAASDFAPIAAAVGGLGQDSASIGKLQQAAAGLQANATDVIAASKNLEQALLDNTGRRGKWLPYAGFIASGIAVLLLILFVVMFYSNLRARVGEAEEKDAKQQQAILNLLDEITNLANGDLTVDVTVTEDFTGAIADSINYTVQTLRGLVGTINQTSEQIVSSAASTQDTAQRMSQASDRQAREVVAAANAITATSQQLQDVAGRAERIAVQAQTSVQIAHNGASTVGRTIQNMAVLREQIQDTAKRIKRLGESSQEIGNIIEFINDIAEQTNTLALNASIQAAMAGEAGRGFAVVADEVQRLAERAGSATRQIENLVKTIQADTNEAIVSMERSTSNVVAGAKSAEEAGQALTRIEASSQELAKGIQDISVAARSQSAEATKIAGTMQGIREIAVQTSSSASTTSHAIGELNQLSDKLRESVAGFKLPEGAGA
ncbi:MAG TPA: methyl-accepting chemotaxis protein [Nevskia sp.]|nr:methyl-accepting chemotaxis protein [Nevskia sp.]